MRTKIFALASLLIIASMVLGACAPAATPAPSEPQVTTVVETVVVTVEGETQVQVVTATPEPAAPPTEWKSKDPTTLVDVTFGDPETLDPALAYDTASGGIIFNVYDTLIFYNKNNPVDFIPQLATEVPTAENGGIVDEGKTFIFKIRSGVKFHDGSEMTPSDVAFSMQRNLLQGGTASPQWLLTEPFLGVGVDDITAIITASLAGPDVTSLYDDPANLALVPADVLAATCKRVTDAIVADDAAGTVTFKLAQPWGPFIATLANSWGSVQSKAWIGANGGWDGDCATWQNFYGKTSEELNKTALGSGAMGTGPYMLDKWTPGEELVLKANENYWRTEPAWEGGPVGAPAIKTVIIKNVSEFSTRYAMLQAGDADFIALGSGPADYPQMDELTGIECEKTIDACTETDPEKPLRVVKPLDGTNRTDLFMTFIVNTEGGNNYIGSGALDGNGIPADFFNDVHIRKAMAYCFNYDTYLADVLLGEGERNVNVMLPGMIGYTEDTGSFTYDPAKCQEEFQLSELKSADGANVWDTGFRFTMAFNTGNTARQTIGQILQTELAAINEKFVVEVTGLPWPAFLQATRASKLPMFSGGWQEDIHDPHNWVQPYTTGTYGARQKMDPEIKAQFGEIMSRAVSETDPAARTEIYREFNTLFYDSIPTILLFTRQGRSYHQRWVQGYYSNPIYPSFYFYPLSKQ